jgi:hypothetical protein
VPIRKFHSVEEIPGPPPGTPLDPDNLRQAFELSRLAYGLRPWARAPGVHKFRSVADLKRVKDG